MIQFFFQQIKCERKKICHVTSYLHVFIQQLMIEAVAFKVGFLAAPFIQVVKNIFCLWLDRKLK